MYSPGIVKNMGQYFEDPGDQNGGQRDRKSLAGIWDIYKLNAHENISSLVPHAVVKIAH